MAEVTIRLPKQQTLISKEPGVEVTAREAPPSMTYTTPSVQVGMEPMVAFMTYLDNNPVELSGNTARHTTNDVEITASTERTVQSDDPIPVEVEGSTRRLVTTDVEITAPLVRNVTSFRINLEYSTRRDVINSGDLEVGLRRDVEARIEIEATTTRLVLNDEDSEIGIPSKEYGSFVEPNKLFRVQHDVLNEDVSDNPYFERQISNLRNAALLTRNQTVIKAINELFVSQREAFLSTFTALEKVNVTLGDMVVDKELKDKYAKMGAENVIDGLVKLSENIDSIIDFVGMQADSLPYYEELGYKDLLETLKGMNEKIKTIDFDWSDLTTDDLGRMFRSTDYIPEIKDQVFTLLEQMQEEIDAFKNGLARQFMNLKSETELTLANQYQTLIEKMNSPYERITEQEVRDMFRTIGQDAIPEDDEDVYFQMFQSLAERLKVAEETFEAQIDAIKRSQLDLLQDLEGWASVTLREVREMFGDISEDEDAQDVYVELFRTFSERLDTYQTKFEQMLAGLEERVKKCELLDDWAAITEHEVKKIFDLMDPDAEPDEDRYAELFQILSDRIANNRERIESYIEYNTSQIDDYASITEKEIRRIFEILQDQEDPERTFEDYVIELIKGITTRLVAEEESTTVIRDLIRHMEESNISITEAEIRRIFSLLKDEDEPEEDFEARLIGIIKALDDRIDQQEDVASLLQDLIIQLQSESASITEDEVRALFAMLQDEDVEAFKDALTLTINRLDARVTEQERISQELKALTDQLQNENVNITEEEVLKIFAIMQEDSESEKSFEERITAAIAEWQDRIVNAEDVVAELKFLLENHLESGSDITEEEIREVFRSLMTEEDDETFEERISSIINALVERVTISELTAARLAELANQIKAENADITQDEIQGLFDLIQESEEDYEQRIVSVITEWQDRVEAESRRIDNLEEVVEQLKVSGVDVTEEEVRELFSMFDTGEGAGDSDSFEARISGILNSLIDRIVAQEEESERLKERIDTLEGQIDGFNRGLDLLSRSISARVTDFTNEVNEKVRYILSALENAQDAIEGKVTYDTLVAYLESEMAATKTTLNSLDNRVTGLETKVESAFTEDDISTADEIKALFDPIAWFDDYEEATEDDIREMFEPKLDEDGNPAPSTIETVQKILDIIVSEESIMDLFRPYIGDVEVHTMEELLEALANRNNV